MPTKPLASSSQGFTLIEVVIATFIVGIALIATIGTIQSITQQTVRLEEKFIANIIANNTLVQLQLRPVWPEVGEEDLDTEMAGRAWFSDITIEATEVDTLRRVEINVGIDDDEHQTSTYLVGFVSASSPITQNPVDWLGQNNTTPNPQNPNANNPNPNRPNPIIPNNRGGM